MTDTKKPMKVFMSFQEFISENRLFSDDLALLSAMNTFGATIGPQKQILYSGTMVTQHGRWDFQRGDSVRLSRMNQELSVTLKDFRPVYETDFLGIELVCQEGEFPSLEDRESIFHRIRFHSFFTEEFLGESPFHFWRGGCGFPFLKRPEPGETVTEQHFLESRLSIIVETTDPLQSLCFLQNPPLVAVDYERKYVFFSEGEVSKKVPIESIRLIWVSIPTNTVKKHIDDRDFFIFNRIKKITGDAYMVSEDDKRAFVVELKEKAHPVFAKSVVELKALAGLGIESIVPVLLRNTSEYK